MIEIYRTQDIVLEALKRINRIEEKARIEHTPITLSSLKDYLQTQLIAINKDMYDMERGIQLQYVDNEEKSST